MKRTFSLLLSILFCSFLIAHAKTTAQTQPLVFSHVTVIDVVRGALNKDVSVIISGNRIIAVGKTGRLRVPKDALVVNASGKFLLPGLCDMHVHALDDKQARDVGPRVILGTPVVDGPVPMWPESIPVADAAAGRKLG